MLYVNTIFENNKERIFAVNSKNIDEAIKRIKSIFWWSPDGKKPVEFKQIEIPPENLIQQDLEEKTTKIKEVVIDIEKYNQYIDRIVDLKHQGVFIRDICKELGLSNRTVPKYYKYYLKMEEEKNGTSRKIKKTKNR